MPNDTYSTYDGQPTEDVDSDGEVGIGPSLLQDLANGSDLNDNSIIEHATVHHDNESTVEGLTYDEHVVDQPQKRRPSPCLRSSC